MYNVAIAAAYVGAVLVALAARLFYWIIRKSGFASTIDVAERGRFGFDLLELFVSSANLKGCLLLLSNFHGIESNRLRQIYLIML